MRAFIRVFLVSLVFIHSLQGCRSDSPSSSDLNAASAAQRGVDLVPISTCDNPGGFVAVGEPSLHESLDEVTTDDLCGEWLGEDASFVEIVGPGTRKLTMKYGARDGIHSGVVKAMRWRMVHRVARHSPPATAFWIVEVRGASNAVIASAYSHDLLASVDPGTFQCVDVDWSALDLPASEVSQVTVSLGLVQVGAGPITQHSMWSSDLRVTVE